MSSVGMAGAAWGLRIGGALAYLASAAAVVLLQTGGARLLRWGVPDAVLYGILAAGAIAFVLAISLRNGLAHLAALALLAVAAAGIHDVTAVDPRFIVLLVGFLFAAELPHGAQRLARLAAAVRAERGSQAARDLAGYALHYAVLGTVTLALLAGLTILALRAPEVALGSLGTKYQEALETRSVFFVVAVTWLLLAPFALARALAGLRRHETVEHPRPTSPVATGALKVESSASSTSQPLIEVTQ